MKNHETTKRSHAKVSLATARGNSPKTIFKNVFRKSERRNEMRKNNLIKTIRQSASTAIFLLMFVFMMLLNGCGDSNVANIQNGASGNSGSSDNIKAGNNDSTIIRLDMSIKFKSEILNDSKLLESNNGNSFNHIVSFSKEVKPGEILDLEELQPTGIFTLYLSSTGLFALTNDDGLSFSAKTVLMEKCEFINLKLHNNGPKLIVVTGILAGE